MLSSAFVFDDYMVDVERTFLFRPVYVEQVAVTPHLLAFWTGLEDALSV